MVSPTCIITISDSRGRHLENFLRKSGVLPSETIVIEQSLGGAGYEILFREVRHYTSKAERQYPEHKILVLILGGICDFTTKTKNDISFITKQSRVERIKETLGDIVNYATERSFYLAISTVIPAGLAKANNVLQSKKNVKCSFTDTEIQVQQGKLEAEISEINQYITGKIAESGAIIVNTHNLLETSSCQTLGGKKNIRNG